MMMRFATRVAFRCAVALLCATSAFAQGSPQGSPQGNKGEIDPGAVSDGLKAIFSYSSGNKSTRERLNANTVTVMTGTIGGTYVQFGADLARCSTTATRCACCRSSVADRCRASPTSFSSRGSISASCAPTRSITWKGRATRATSADQFAYITKLYNEEMHVVAQDVDQKPRAISNGKRVAVDLPNGGTFVTAITIFERLGIKPVYAFIEQRVAYEKLKSGELDAVVAVQGSPSKAVSQVKGDNLHFVPIPYSGAAADAITCRPC